jgi:hypothetical protein
VTGQGRLELMIHTEGAEAVSSLRASLDEAGAGKRPELDTYRDAG